MKTPDEDSQEQAFQNDYPEDFDPLSDKSRAAMDSLFARDESPSDESEHEFDAMADALHWKWMIEECDADPGDVCGWDGNGNPIFGFMDGKAIIGFVMDSGLVADWEPIFSDNYTPPED